MSETSSAKADSCYHPVLHRSGLITGWNIHVVIDALRHIGKHPRLLDQEREKRFDGPPPPISQYSAFHSGVSTMRGYTPPEVTEYYEAYERERMWHKSTPSGQFRSQTFRVLSRLTWENVRGGWLPFDKSLEYKANAENIVRSRWVDQGIWADEWGPAWPSGCSSTIALRPGGPGWNGRYVNGERWGHEEAWFSQGTERSPSPSPAVPELDELDEEPSTRARSLTRRLQQPKKLVPRPTVHDPEASRPRRQFQYQVAKESEWLMLRGYTLDGRPLTRAEADSIAYTSVRDDWRDEKLWIPKWGHFDGALPGERWWHEEATDGDQNESRPEASPSPVNPCCPDLLSETEDSDSKLEAPSTGSNDTPHTEELRDSDWVGSNPAVLSSSTDDSQSKAAGSHKPEPEITAKASGLRSDPAGFADDEEQASHRFDLDATAAEQRYFFRRRTKRSLDVGESQAQGQQPSAKRQKPGGR